MPDRALRLSRIARLARTTRALRLKASNARQGIKTPLWEEVKYSALRDV